MTFSIAFTDIEIFCIKPNLPYFTVQRFHSGALAPPMKKNKFSRRSSAGSLAIRGPVRTPEEGAFDIHAGEKSLTLIKNQSFQFHYSTFPLRSFSSAN